MSPLLFRRLVVLLVWVPRSAGRRRCGITRLTAACPHGRAMQLAPCWCLPAARLPLRRVAQLAAAGGCAALRVHRSLTCSASPRRHLRYDGCGAVSGAAGRSQGAERCAAAPARPHGQVPRGAAQAHRCLLVVKVTFPASYLSFTVLRCGARGLPCLSLFPRHRPPDSHGRAYLARLISLGEGRWTRR